MTIKNKLDTLLQWPFVLLLLIPLGFLMGLGIFTFIYAEGFSYASSDPKVCINCHVMNHQYDTWEKSGHHHVATCNDCHLPAKGIMKLVAKARNGFDHSLAFTLENFESPILIKKHNKEILQENCVRCHEGLVHDAILTPTGGDRQAQSCIHCHRSTGHIPIQ